MELSPHIEGGFCLLVMQRVLLMESLNAKLVRSESSDREGLRQAGILRRLVLEQCGLR